LGSELAALCTLAKLEPGQVSVVSEAGANGATGQIELVIRDGLEVLIPLAGAAFARNG
jgi:hypothetical protein